MVVFLEKLKIWITRHNYPVEGTIGRLWDPKHPALPL